MTSNRFSHSGSKTSSPDSSPARVPLLIVHYHEVGLKGRNREFFEDALTRNIKRALRGTGYTKAKRGFGRIAVQFEPDGLIDIAAERAARVFGVAYVGVGVKVKARLEEITEAAVEVMGAEPFDSFAVRARRAYSTLDVSAHQLNVHVGQAIVDSTGGRVDLSNPGATAWIELFGSTVAVFRKKLKGPGGLPVGVSGKMIALISGGIDSPVAAWRMARRGAEVEYLHFHGQPYTDPSSVRQTREILEVLVRYQLSVTMHLVPLGDAQREIVTHAPAHLRTILYRRTMMRIAAAVAAQRGAKALITGDSLGQVASQTIENITSVDAAVPGTQVLRPLIGNDKQEIIDEAAAIGTFALAVREYQDCCVLFEPRQPATRANPFVSARAEDELDMDAMVGKALVAIETTEIQLQAPA
jgi:thiamine biosynthesis protein ThiI